MVSLLEGVAGSTQVQNATWAEKLGEAVAALLSLPRVLTNIAAGVERGFNSLQDNIQEVRRG